MQSVERRYVLAPRKKSLARGATAARTTTTTMRLSAKRAGQFQPRASMRGNQFPSESQAAWKKNK